MITRVEDLRPGRYRARQNAGGYWVEIHILPHPPDRFDQVLFSIRDFNGSLGYGMILIENGVPYIFYPKMSPLPIILEPIEPEASISHVRRVEL